MSAFAGYRERTRLGGLRPNVLPDVNAIQLHDVSRPLVALGNAVDEETGTFPVPGTDGYVPCTHLCTTLFCF